MAELMVGMKAAQMAAQMAVQMVGMKAASMVDLMAGLKGS
jgi:hypothetical protein